MDLFRKSEFLLALLLRLGETTDPITYKEYYTRSSNKGYTPSQIELGLLLLREKSPEGISWLNKASNAVRQKTKKKTKTSSDYI